MIGLTIGDKHTYRDWGLYMVSVDLPMPEAKTNLVEVPCRDGSLDLTEALDGTVRFKNRSISIAFDITGQFEKWQTVYSMIASYCHGQRKRIIFDTDPAYYYDGRVSVSSAKETLIDGTLTLSIDAEPYKNELSDTTEPWLWDTFNFKTGAIRQYKNLSVPGTYTLIGTNRVIVPEITCSTAMMVTVGKKTFDLKASANKISDIRILPGENVMKFIGSGTVTINFRGCSL